MVRPFGSAYWPNFAAFEKILVVVFLNNLRLVENFNYGSSIPYSDVPGTFDNWPI